MPVASHKPSFDPALYSAALAYYGLPADYCRVFTTLPLLDPETKQPRKNEQGDPMTVLMACSAPTASTQSKAVWVQVNRPREDAARTGNGHPKKAKNREIASLANVTLDFEYPQEPQIAHRIGKAMASFLVVQGLALPGLPVEDSGAGCHIVLPLPPIELCPDTAERWNQAVACVVKTWILPEFVRLCAQEQITMDLSGYDISRVLSVPGTWRPTSPKKPDCDALKQGYLRRWLPPYTGTVYPVRRESARLAELIREAYESPPPPRTPSPAAAREACEDPHVWLTAYATAHPCPDRSACFQRLVSAVYLKFGEETVHTLRDDIHTLSGEKYNGRLEAELARSLARTKAHPRLPDGGAAPCQQETKHDHCKAVLSGDPSIDQAILARDKAALYQLAPQIAELSELALSRVRLALKEIWGPGFPLREFDDVLKAERRQAHSLRSRQVEVKSARELMATPFAPVEWVVPGILPVGLIALAGKQKIGKSWLDDNVGIAIASGGKAFGSILCTQGDVLYLALEDNDRRMQERIKAVLAPGEEVPEGFYYATSWPRMDQDGLAALEDWIVVHPAARLIIIDPWVKVKPRIKARPGETGYDADYEALEGLKRLCDTYHLCILVQFHLRKAGAEDPFDELNGTSGITACADGFLSLKRARGEATAALWGTGRDYQEDVDLALRFDGGIWTILGSASAYALSQASREVLEVLRAAGRPLRPKDIAEVLDLPVGTIRKRLLDMKQRGEISDTGKGYVANGGNGGNGGNAGSLPGIPHVSGVQGVPSSEQACSKNACEEASAGKDASHVQTKSVTSVTSVPPLCKDSHHDNVERGGTRHTTSSSVISSVLHLSQSVPFLDQASSGDLTEEGMRLNHEVKPTASNAVTSVTSVPEVGTSSSTSHGDNLFAPTCNDELPSGCTICSGEVERYSAEGTAYCADHFLGDDAPTHSSLTSEPFMAAVRRIAAVFPGGCTVHVDPPG